MKWFYLALLAVQYLQSALCAKILALCVVTSPSHSLWCYKYMAILAERGHEITVLGVDKPKIKIPNLTTFIVNGAYDILTSNISVSEMFEDDDGKVSSMYPGFKIWTELSSVAILHSKAVKDLIQKYENVKKPFDLIIHDNGCMEAILGFVPIFGNPPLLLATTFGSPQWMMTRVGNILNPAFVPTMITNADQHMTFYERCYNTFYYVFLEWFYQFVTEPFQDNLMKEVFGENIPPIKDIARQANIIIVNYHFALNCPRPLLPGVIGIAGLHISDPQPLPQDIQNFMDGAEHGAILLSFGTNVNSNWLPKNFESIILEALGQIPQRVLWKWDKILPNTPANVKMSKWLPQGDMLVHPNMRLFITHCGLLSTQEAIYRKVLILALPVFIDQIDNAARLVRSNVTIRLNVRKLTANELRDGINEILSNPMYKKNIEKLGDLMTDVPLTAQQQAVFWTEYAMRHQGAAHLRSAAADMPWYQLLLLDILGAILLALLVILWAVKYLLVFIFQRLRSSKSKTKSD